MSGHYVDLILDNPALALALVAIIRYAVAWQRGLSYPEFRLAHMVKCRAFGLVDPVARRYGRPLVATKAYGTESPEFVGNYHHNARTVAKRIDDVFSGHLIATAKRRETTDGRQWAHSQWRKRHTGDKQTEVYLFPTSDGTDVYAHVETSVEDPEGHLRDEQTPGDALDAFASAYGGA